MRNWEEAQLWQQLLKASSSEAEEVRTMLRSCMPDIQTVLAQSGASPIDFTLHDAQHSFRVSQRMVEIIPTDVLPKLTAYELALLLLSAYLHDIGMSPSRKKVSGHYQYLLTGDKSWLTEQDLVEFQKWLDDQSRETSVPICKGKPTTEDFALAEELTAYYCRGKHNEWSGEWMQQNLAKLKMSTYNRWLDDLIMLCKSHHYGYIELKKDVYAPRVVDANSNIVHLRYLACVLRVADVLECDPERTPEVLFKHRNIVPSSEVYWWKDHDIHPFLEQTSSGKRLIVNSRPSYAVIHRSVEITVAQIESELILCRRIADETHFEKGPLLINTLPHRWDLLSHVHVDITPKENTYEYIQGAFRPNTQKLLELFGGEELYGTPFAAVRELLQNAFDAIKEQVAYERLQQDDPSDPDLEKSLGNLHQVKLSLNRIGSDLWLVCRDDGVGMNKTIIENYLLVSGTSRRHDIIELERRCKNKGFSTGRTGQFGIGVLSYFMLADYIQILTRRSQDAGDSETTGWYFQTNGVGDFGELRSDSSLVKGTEIRLRLRTNIIGEDPNKWFKKLRKYIINQLLRVPCKFALHTNMFDFKSEKIASGWCFVDENYKSKIIKGFLRRLKENKDENELTSKSHVNKYLNYRGQYEDIIAAIKNQLKVKSIEQGEFPSKTGHYRIILPYFELFGGVSLMFSKVVKQEDSLYLEKMAIKFNHPYEKHEVIELSGEVKVAWKGMKVDSVLITNNRNWQSKGDKSFKSLHLKYIMHNDHNEYQYLSVNIPVFIEVDWSTNSYGKTSLNRDKVVLSQAMIEDIHWLNERLESVFCAFLGLHKKSEFALLNYVTLDLPWPEDVVLNWKLSNHQLHHKLNLWGPIYFPATISIPIVRRDKNPYLSADDNKDRIKGWRWLQKKVTIFDSINTDSLVSRSMLLFFNYLPPDKIVWYVGEGGRLDQGISCLWADDDNRKALQEPIIKSTFPDVWVHLFCVILEFDNGQHEEEYLIVNRNNLIGRLCFDDQWEWCNNTFDYDNLNPLKYKKEILCNKHKAAAWLNFFIMYSGYGVEDYWQAIIEKDSKFIEDLFTLLDLKDAILEGQPGVMYWSKEELNILTPKKYEAFYDLEKIKNYLPFPGDTWTLFAE